MILRYRNLPRVRNHPSRLRKNSVGTPESYWSARPGNRSTSRRMFRKSIQQSVRRETLRRKSTRPPYVSRLTFYLSRLLSAARAPLVDFFSILLERLAGRGGCTQYPALTRRLGE